MRAARYRGFESLPLRQFKYLRARGCMPLTGPDSAEPVKIRRGGFFPPFVEEARARARVWHCFARAITLLLSLFMMAVRTVRYGY